MITVSSLIASPAKQLKKIRRGKFEAKPLTAYLFWLNFLTAVAKIIMAANTSTTFDSLAILIQAIAHDRKLQEWFSGLAKKSTVARRNEILATVGRMTEQGEDPKIISALFLLTEEKVFAVTRQILLENRHIKE